MAVTALPPTSVWRLHPHRARGCVYRQVKEKQVAEIMEILSSEGGHIYFDGACVACLRKLTCRAISAKSLHTTADLCAGAPLFGAWSLCVCACSGRTTDFLVILHGLMSSNNKKVRGNAVSGVGYMELEDHPKTVTATRREDIKTRVRLFLDDPSSCMLVRCEPHRVTVCPRRMAHGCVCVHGSSCVGVVVVRWPFADALLRALATTTQPPRRRCTLPFPVICWSAGAGVRLCRMCACCGVWQARLVSVTIILTIAVSTGAFVVETLPQYHQTNQSIFQLIETISVAIFTTEYLLR